MPTEPESNAATSPLKFPEAYNFYEDGKHRRHELLFAVNGGAFAIAKLTGTSPALGGLKLPYLAIGMVLFTITMVVDIYRFGMNWHKIGRSIEPSEPYTIFGRTGRVVLILIGALISLGAC